MQWHRVDETRRNYSCLHSEAKECVGDDVNPRDVRQSSSWIVGAYGRGVAKALRRIVGGVDGERCMAIFIAPLEVVAALRTAERVPTRKTFMLIYFVFVVFGSLREFFALVAC